MGGVLVEKGLESPIRGTVRSGLLCDLARPSSCGERGDEKRNSAQGEG